jgi:condensin-2 complex subunit D3
MGKLCLRDRNRARDSINVFLRELHQGATNSAAIRSNALLVLGDLCVRYTSLVDRHIGAMAACLQDPEVLVRRHALVLLAQLLLQDYLKWRGLLLFRFLAAAADSDPDTAELAKTVLKSTVLVKHPEFFCQHFTEAVVIFNHCVEHPSYASAATYGSEGTSSQQVTMDGVNLAGGEREQRARRMRLFEIMLETFSEEQRIQVTAKLVQDVLAYAVDHVQLTRGAAASSFENALEDTFLVLQSPLLRVGRRACDDAAAAVGADGEDGEEEEATNAAAAAGEAKGKGAGKNKPNSLAGAKTKVLKTLSKQHLISHTLPVVSSLKHALEAARSPLQGPLMDLLVALVKANRAEVNEVFENDPTLRIEVEYDIKMHDRAKERAAAAAAAEIEAAVDACAAEQEAQTHPVSPVKGEQQVTVLGLRSVTKPALKKSLLDGPESASRTSREAIMQSAKKSQDSKASADEELAGDFADRLLGGGCGGDAADAEPQRPSRRSNWTAVTVGLTDENAYVNNNIFAAPLQPTTGPTPVKKRGKKPTSPRPSSQPTRTSSRRAVK